MKATIPAYTVARMLEICEEARYQVGDKVVERLGEGEDTTVIVRETTIVKEFYTGKDDEVRIVVTETGQFYDQLTGMGCDAGGGDAGGGDAPYYRSIRFPGSRKPIDIEQAGGAA